MIIYLFREHGELEEYVNKREIIELIDELYEREEAEVSDVRGRGEYLMITVAEIDSQDRRLIVERFRHEQDRDVAYYRDVPCSGTCRAHYRLDL